MITKLIQSGSFDFDEPVARVLNTSARNVKLAGFAKAAGIEALFPQLASCTPPENHTVVHVIAVGDSERWGPNRNCDSFSRSDNVRKHRTFVDLGHVFRNHKNQDPSLKIGDVLASAHNDQMDRIELVLALDNEKCRDDIQKMDADNYGGVSMGSRQAKDVCSFCGHEAKTASAHCNHVKYHLGEVAEDGTKIAMLNPDPNYFDISLVWKPADRVAYALRKIASPAGVLGGHDLAREYGMAHDSVKRASLERIASILKTQPAQIRIVRPGNLEALPKSMLKAACSRHGTSAVIGYLHKHGFMLSPADFGELVLNIPGDKMDAACSCFSRPIDEMLEDEQEIPECMSGDQHRADFVDPDVVDDMLTSHISMDAKPVRERAMKVVIIQPEHAKVAQYTDIPELQGLADLYAHYKLAFVSVNHVRSDRVVNAARTFLLP